jgi:hypothetical protein
MEKVGIFLVVWNILRTAIWYTLWPIGNLVVIWYIFPRFGILWQKKLATLFITARRQALKREAPAVVITSTKIGLCRLWKKENDFLNLPPHTQAGFELTTHNSAGGDDTTRPRLQRWVC